ncbi:PHD finger protein 20 isoform X2 [Coccinella septempunctata]|uniref:PHD finger protein 20 isoform X2 n=1 Tax=Coccinella septempunctata TaxID=41139 RepID=UPI001D0616FC|nr:PHD finger protein 20 isoform X2 [Coccinella septempunctata]
MGRKCSVQGCLSDSNREEDVGVTFHKVPMQPDVRCKWLGLCRISEEKKSIKVIHICSRHFLRADFCNFKGKKYMLRQGVFPSVFPWDKSKLEAIKSEKQQLKAQISNIQPLTENEKVSEDRIRLFSGTSTIGTSLDTGLKNEIKKEPSPIEFFIDNRINALDFNDKWCPARIKEVDEEENEVLIHFETNGNEYDEWICMDSPRLRSLDWKEDYQQLEEHSCIMANLAIKIPELNEEAEKDHLEGKNPLKYECGERCLAYWSKRKKFPATINKALENDNYEVLFDDGYVKSLKWSRIVKVNQQLQSSPLFDPIQSSKQERRDKKRKINVAELFGIGKRQKTESTPSSPKVKTTCSQECLPKKLEEDWESWVDGHPVGTDSQLEFQDGTKKTVIVPDPRLPEGWTKHLTKRCQGFNAGKWDTIIVSPDGKKFRSKTDIKHYLETTKVMLYDEKLFDFRIVPQRPKKSGQIAETKKNTEGKSAKLPENEPFTLEETNEDEANLLKIPLVDDAYKCPIDGCDKSFRKENLAQMHVKHYHPEYSKFLDTTPNVADLAYARTVGDSLDKSPVPSKSTRVKHIISKVTQNQPNSPFLEESETNSQTLTHSSKTKDSEIIKLLNAKPYDSKSEGEPLPPGLPPNMYPVIKLKDLLNKSEGIPQKDDINLQTLCATRPTVGIKTLLPVRKPEVKNEEEQIQEVTPKIKPKLGGKRKKVLNEQVELGKTIDVKEELPLQNLPPQMEPAIVAEGNNVIIEGGELIKIVRMKQEEIINCTCGFMEEDGLMIQCELCLCWQHAYCNNIQKESEVPEKYICYICQHPLRQRSSKKFFHDQDWLKLGVLPVGSYHSKDEELLQKRFEKLKKSHDITGGLVELQEFVNVLKVKQKIAKAKNHPKLYLWSKPWEKLPLPEKMEDKKEDSVEEEGPVGHSENEEENQLNRELKNLIESNQPQVPIIPQPEAAIETSDCKLNLLDHILHSQNLAMGRLDTLENELDKLEENLSKIEKDDNCPRMRQTLQMLMRDLNKLEELSQNTSI